MVMFIYRPEYYKEGVDSEDKPKGYTIIDIAKHRNGKLGEVELKFVGQYARFEEFDQGFNNSNFTSIGPNNQFDQPQVYSSKMNDDDSMTPYTPSITSDEPVPF
jgi:replicative DNA helicase